MSKHEKDYDIVYQLGWLGKGVCFSKKDCWKRILSLFSKNEHRRSNVSLRILWVFFLGGGG